MFFRALHKFDFLTLTALATLVPAPDPGNNLHRYNQSSIYSTTMIAATTPLG
jgi:hypothetical protein